MSSSAAENCFACGSATVARRRRLLNSPAVRRTLDAYEQVGLPEERLPASLPADRHDMQA